jgi:hypothetical protein
MVEVKSVLKFQEMNNVIFGQDQSTYLPVLYGHFYMVIAANC